MAAKKRKRLIEQVGITGDGRPVFSGVFKMQDTYGLPLLLVWKTMADMGGIIVWDCYCYDALAHGWSKEKIFAGIREVANFCYEREDGKLLLAGITKLLEEQHENNPEVGDNQVAVRSDAGGDCGSTAVGD